jgi:hypothetical protein
MYASANVWQAWSVDKSDQLEVIILHTMSRLRQSRSHTVLSSTTNVASRGFASGFSPKETVLLSLPSLITTFNLPLWIFERVERMADRAIPVNVSERYSIFSSGKRWAGPYRRRRGLRLLNSEKKMEASPAGLKARPSAAPSHNRAA